MTDFTDNIRRFVQNGAVIASYHARARLQEKSISYRQLIDTLGAAEVLDRYPDYWHGPCFLARHVMADGRVLHAVWSKRIKDEKLAVLVTSYWPDAGELRKRR